MTAGRRAFAGLLSVAMMANVTASKAGVWVMNPVVGVLGDYSSNPSLIYGAHDTGVTSGALQVDVPTVYQGDAFNFAVLPSGRLSDSNGFSYATSDYEHLTLKGEYDAERSSLIATGGLSRDSSLAYNNLASGTTGVRRDAELAELNWDEHLTERVEYAVDASTQLVHFGQHVGVSPLALSDYEYSSIAPGFAWNGSERQKFTLSGGISRYDSIDTFEDVTIPLIERVVSAPISTESRSASLQIGFVRQLSELWTLTALGGYSRALNAQSGYTPSETRLPSGNLLIEVLPTEVTSAQNGTVYSANLSRKGTLLALNAAASRQLAPTGFAFLSREELYELNAVYTLSERWSFSGDAKVVRYQNPPISGQASQVNTEFFTLAAKWHWTERWIMALSATRVSESIQASPYNAASNEITFTLSRQFDPLTF